MKQVKQYRPYKNTRRAVQGCRWLSQEMISLQADTLKMLQVCSAGMGSAAAISVMGRQ
jgi:hypothetical protein